MQSLRLLSNWLLSIKLSLIWHWKHNPYFYTMHLSLTTIKALKLNKILNWTVKKNQVLFSVLSFLIHSLLLVRDSFAVFSDIGVLFFIFYHFAVFYEIILTLRLVMDWNPGHNPQDALLTNLIVNLTDPYFSYFAKFSSSLTTALGSVVLFDLLKRLCQLGYKLYVFSGNTYYHEAGYIEDFEFLQRICRHEAFKFS